MRQLLIANRGEIAVRIARTAHRLGIATVGVHSDADRAALHVASVDRSVHLGGAAPGESYLRAEAVLDAAMRTGCDAVHPGYGFLAENATFAAAVESAGLTWVGPTPEQIELLGDKVAAKRAALQAGVPTTAAIEIDPGEVAAGRVPVDVPMPALVKAAAGGGGRGMRVVRSPDELVDAVAAASREAAAAFGDGTVFIEAYLEGGRHIEVQVLGDAHGQVVHLGERDCSIQRRNQKVVEESPAPRLDPELRDRLCDGAVALARHVGYRGAGTVEYLVGVDGTVTFLEVNTRLQVEHPVTEAVTGLDLVEQQLRIADGEPLGLEQSDIRLDGHAIEVRLVAEDPAAGWVPSTGRLDRFEMATDAPGLRCDAAVTTGSIVSPEYDSLLAKVIAHAPTRDEATRRLERSLRRSWISGVRTDLSTLVAILGHEAFLVDPPSTAFLERHPEVTQAPPGALETEPDSELRALLVAAVLLDEADARSADANWGFAPPGWRNLSTQGQRTRWSAAGPDGEPIDVEVVRAVAGPDRPDVIEILVGPPPTPDDVGALGPDERTRHTVRTVDAAREDRCDRCWDHVGADARARRRRPGAAGRAGPGRLDGRRSERLCHLDPAPPFRRPRRPGGRGRPRRPAPRLDRRRARRGG